MFSGLSALSSCGQRSLRWVGRHLLLQSFIRVLKEKGLKLWYASVKARFCLGRSSEVGRRHTSKLEWSLSLPAQLQVVLE